MKKSPHTLKLYFNLPVIFVKNISSLPNFIKLINANIWNSQHTFVIQIEEKTALFMVFREMSMDVNSN